MMRTSSRTGGAFASRSCRLGLGGRNQQPNSREHYWNGRFFCESRFRWSEPLEIPSGARFNLGSLDWGWDRLKDPNRTLLHRAEILGPEERRWPKTAALARC